MKKRSLILIILLIMSSLLLIYGISSARYISTSVWDYYLRAKEFYFTSDFLDVTPVKTVNTLWDGKKVTFNIKNNLNVIAITDYDIEYIVTCTIKGDMASHAQCKLNGTTENTFESILENSKHCVNRKETGVDVSEFTEIECIEAGYDWENKISMEELYFEIIPSNPNDELNKIEVNITVESTKPYKKTLTGDFVLEKPNLKEEVKMVLKSYDDYEELIVTNSYNQRKCIKISWDSSKLRLDASPNNFSSYLADTNGFIKEIKFNINAKSNLNLMFYRVYFNLEVGIDDFILTESSGC